MTTTRTDNEVDVERYEDPPPEWVRVKQGRNIETIGGQECLDDPDHLRRQVLASASEAMAEFLKRLPGGLEDEAL